MSFTLVAKFNISHRVLLLLERADDDPLLYEVHLDDYDVSLRFIPAIDFCLKAKVNKHWAVAYTALEIRVPAPRIRIDPRP